MEIKSGERQEFYGHQDKRFLLEIASAFYTSTDKNVINEKTWKI